MQDYLCVAFTLDTCHLALIEKESQTLICKWAESRTHNFDETNELIQLCESLKWCYQKHTRLLIAIPHQKTITQHFMLDATLSDQEIFNFLHARSLETFGYPGEALCIDYEKFSSADKAKQTIKTVATYKIIIDTLSDAFSAEKMIIHAIDVDSYALDRYEQYQSNLTIVNQTIHDKNRFQHFCVCFGLSLWNHA